MTRYYFWIGYNQETEKYQIASTPCIKLECGDSFNLQMISDCHFNGRIKLGDQINIKLISYPCTRKIREIQQIILNHMNTQNKDANVLIEKEINIQLPSFVNDFHNSSSNDVQFNMEDFNVCRPYSHIRIKNGNFNINLNYHSKTDNTKESFYTFSHPFIKM